MNRHTTFIDELDEHNPLLTDIATRDVVCLAASDSVGEAVATMKKRRISSVVVTDAAGHPAGIVTERNILQAMQENRPYETVLENIMSFPVITASPSTTTLEAYQLCLSNGIRHLVLVGDKGKVTGVVSETDFRLHLNLATLAGRRRVATIAKRTAIALPPSTSLKQAFDMMLEQRKSCVVAVEEGRPVGIVTERDVVNLYAADGSHAGISLGDAMSAPVRTISQEASTSRAAEEMLASRQRHLVVVDHGGHMSGLLSEHDLTQALEVGLAERRRSIEENFLRTLINTIPDLVWLKDADGVYLACNARFESFFGASERQILGKSDYDFIDRETADAFREHDRLAMDADRPLVNEEWITYATDGHRELLETVKIPMRDASGKLLGVLGVARDITERKRLEEKLEQKERKLHDIYDSVGDCIEIISMDGVILEMNRAGYERQGYTREEMVGRKLSEFASPEFAPQVAEHIVRIKAKGEATFESERLHKDGTVIPVEVSSRLIELDGQPVFLGISRDITERKRAEKELHEKEERLALATLHNGVGIWDWNLVTQEMVWDDSMYALYHIRREDFSGSEEAWRASLHPDDLERGDREVKEAIAGTKPFDTEFRVVWPGGEVRHIKAVAKVFRDEQGKPLRMLGTNVDITERKRVEMALVESEHRYRTLVERSPFCIHEVDLEGRFLSMNEAGLAMLNLPGPESLCGRSIFDAVDEENAARLREYMQEAIEGGSSHFEFSTAAMPPRHLKSCFVPLHDSEGRVMRLMGLTEDITERKRNDAVNTSRWHLAQFALKHSLDELLEETLNEAEKLTGSLIGFYHFVEDDQISLTLQNWSKRTKAEFCKAEGKGMHYPIDEAGVWVDCVRERKPVIHNDYASLPHRKGLPEGHAAVIRELVVPVYRGDKITAILGVGNKPTDYTEQDLEVVSMLADVAWEIADRKRSDEALRISRNRYDDLIRRIPVGVYTFRFHADGSFGFDFVSPRFCQIFGQEEAEVMRDAQIVFDGAHPDDYEGLMRANQDAFESQQPFRWEGRFIVHGETRWLSVSSDPSPLVDGESVWNGVVRDVTERRSAEQQLEEYRQRLEGQVAEESTKFRALVEQSLVGIYIIQNGTFRYVNPGMADIFGYDSPKDIVGKIDVKQLVAPEDHKKVSANLLRWQDGKTGFMRYSLNSVKRDGTPIVIEVHGSRIEYQGKPAVIGTLVDITEEHRNREELLHMAEEKAAELTRKENIYSAIFRQSDSAIELIDPETLHFIEVNDAGCSMLGYSHDEMLNMHLMDTQAEMGEAQLRASIEQLPENSSARFENRHRCKDGTVLDVEITAGVQDLGGRRLIVAVWNDITERKRVDESLRITASVFDTSQEAIVITDADNIITDVNPAFERITGYSREEVLGKNPGLLSSGRHGREFYTSMWQSLVEQGAWRGEIWNRRKNGEIYAEMLSISVIRDRDGKVLRHVAVFSDISHIKAHEAELSRVAHYDALTGIPNRVLLADRMKQALARTKRERNMMAVCYIDLDGFKPINDNLGHDAGDHVLMEVSRRIEGTIRGGDTVARLGGDEFVILLLGLNHAEECAATLKRLLRAIAIPIDIDNQTATVGASIGVSIYPQDDGDTDTLLRHADQAMYIAKQAGKHRYHIYDPAQDQRARDYNEFRERILYALKQNEFELYYQPKVNLKSKQMLGAEALIRWNHPERGLLPPSEFLPAIENSDLDIMVGEWVIETALTQLDSWRRAGLDIEVSINISACHLESPGFVRTLSDQLARYPELPAGRLQVEVLETAALEDITTVNGIIDTCRGIGVGFALDDFGTGYSSLTYLSRLPVDVLKIDQFFIRDMLEDKGDMAIVQGIIALAEAFELGVVAEGVETEAHYRALVELGCEVGQGYGIARPMPASRLEQWRAE